MQAQINGKILELIRGDITRQETDAIVNAANSGLLGGGGVDGAIHSAGGPQIMAEGRAIGGCPTGSACVTGAGLLKAKFVIHAVGPIWRGGRAGEAGLLESAYRSSLDAADERQLSSISFPSISTGTYRYPLDEAAVIALSTVIDHLGRATPIEHVVFVLYNDKTYDAYERALKQLVQP